MTVDASFKQITKDLAELEGYLGTDGAKHTARVAVQMTLASERSKRNGMSRAVPQVESTDVRIFL